MDCLKLKTIDPEIWSILFFLEKDLGIVSQPYFVLNILRKMFLVLYFLTNQISLSDCLFFLR